MSEGTEWRACGLSEKTSPRLTWMLPDQSRTVAQPCRTTCRKRAATPPPRAVKRVVRVRPHITKGEPTALGAVNLQGPLKQSLHAPDQLIAHVNIVSTLGRCSVVATKVPEVLPRPVVSQDHASSDCAERELDASMNFYHVASPHSASRSSTRHWRSWARV